MAGSYRFTEVLAGDYYVQFEVEDDLVATVANVGGDDTIDSDVTDANGPFTTDIFTLTTSGLANTDLGLLELGFYFLLLGDIAYEIQCRWSSLPRYAD